MLEPANDNWPAIMTVAEVAAALRCSPRHVREILRVGALHSIQIGLGTKRPRLTIAREDLQSYIDRSRRVETCLSTSQKTRRTTSSTSAVAALGFTALRAAQTSGTQRP